MTAEPIAIVGMRGRFPGAGTLDQFWENVAGGVESITLLSQDDMRAAGVPDSITRLPGYVNAAPILENADLFDASFFGFSARDASLTDPQHRLFLETAWEALEDAGYEPGTYPGSIGVFGGCELSSYLYRLYLNIDTLGYLDGMQLMVTNDKDHLCTQVSYRLDLRGPAVVVQTTCSTSLVAVSMACESLRSGTSDMALAGGVTVRVPQRGGYFYTAGSILSPDGHCRPFDASAQGTVVGSGVGLVVLKRLSDAVADGDNIRAVILGVGINNDGSAKAGYTAPSPRGQAAAIRAAQAMAGITPDTIGYVEAHGTGTILGDPIELSALTEVFRASTDRRGFCGIGSVKSNVGHLSCASGVTGLIKTVLALEHAAIPPTVHYCAPNPAIDFAASPFYVTTTLQPWPENGTPRRAGVSSFGVGGTNAHLVLEEAPALPAPAARRPHQVLTVSARSDDALDAATALLADHLDHHLELDLADVAFTLHVGRRQFRHRRVLVAAADDRAGVIASLRQPEALATTVAGAGRPVVFMFSGQGTQYPGMAEGLYRSEPVVKQAIDRCARLLKPELDTDLRRLLFPTARRRAAAADVLQDTAFTQPALFTVEYALAQLWRSWGVEPAAMIGHSIGEYVAAAISGVMGLEDALRLVARRGRLMSGLPTGSMLGVMAPAEALHDFTGEEVSLAAVNAPGFAVLSGPTPAIERVQAALATESIAARKLHTSHAFHSSMMEPILDEFESLVAGVDLSPPAIPYVANLTGAWADGEVVRPESWSAQLRSTVRFADGLRTLAAPGGPASNEAVLLEVGPGQTLVTFALQTGNGSAPVALASLPGGGEVRPDTEVTMASLARLWSAGVAVDWDAFHRTERRRRVSLPTYPFDRQRYWVGAPDVAAGAAPAREDRDPATWFYRSAWRDAPPLATDSSATGRLAGRRILVFDELSGLGAAVVGRLLVAGARPIVVRQGERFEQMGDDEFLLDPHDADSFGQLAAGVCGADSRLAGVIDCWSAEPPASTTLEAAAPAGLLAPLRLAKALSTHPTVRPLPVLLVARGTYRVHDGDPLDPARALRVGAARVLPQEHPGIRVSYLDVDGAPDVADLLVAELAAGAPEPTVALRSGRRFVEIFESTPIASVAPPVQLPERPVCLVTGGLGHMGLILAEALADRLDARLVLVGRSAMPEPDQWAAMGESMSTPADQRERLRRLAGLRERGDDLLVLVADLDDGDQVRTAVDDAIAHFGQVDLVVHGAANLDPAAFATAADTTAATVELQLSPKVRGLFHLSRAFDGREPQRWLIHSSIASMLGGLGLAAYSGANAVLDALAEAGGARWLSVDWDAWDNAGEARSGAMPDAIQPEEGKEVFVRLLGADVGTRLVVAVGDLEARLQAWIRPADSAAAARPAGDRHGRPNLATPFLEPRTTIEQALAEIWADQLGVAPVGVHDRFFDLGGHSLLAVQVAAQIRDRFQIELPVQQLFQAPTVSELAPLVERAQEGGPPAVAAMVPAAVPAAPNVIERPAGAAVEGPGSAAKASYRAFYDDVTRRLDGTGVGEASFFLNYGYLSLGGADERRFEVPDGVFNPSSIRLAFELIGATDLSGARVLDVGCGRGGTVALLADRYGVAEAVGVDLSPEAVAFCARAHRHPAVRFQVGDAERLPFDDATFDAVTNVESSHTYPDLRAFLTEVSRVVRPGGWFLYTDLLPVARWMEVRVLLEPLGFAIADDRDITDNVLASCDEVAATRAEAFGGHDAAIDNFLAVPGSAVYEQMNTRVWEYRILRAHRAF